MTTQYREIIHIPGVISKWKFYTLPWLIALFSGLFASPNETILAWVGEQKITCSQFQEYLDFTQQRKADLTNFVEMKKLLNDLINQKLMVEDALRNGIDKDPQINIQIRQFEEQALLNYVQKKEIIEKAIPEDLLYDTYQKMGKIAKLRHLLLVVEESGENDQEMAQLARELHCKLEEGEDFSRLARLYSKDLATKESGGNLGWVRWGNRFFGDPFYEAAFQLQIGEISLPVKAKYGYHLIKMEDFREIKLGSFADQKSEILNYYLTERDHEIKIRKLEFFREIRKQNHIQIKEENLSYIYDIIKKARQVNAFQLKDRVSLALKVMLKPEELSKELIIRSDSVYTILDFISNRGKNLALGDNNLDSYEDFFLYFGEILPHNQLMIGWAYQNKYHHSDYIKTFIKKQKEYLLIREIERITLYDNVLKFTEAEQKKYYQQHKEKYLIPGKVLVQEILVSEKKLAEKIIEMAKTGLEFDTLAEKYNQRKSTKSKNGILGFITADLYGVIGENALNMGVGEISRPLKTTEGFSVIKILQKQDKIQRSYEQAKLAVEEDLKIESEQSLRRDWLAGLRKEIPVKIEGHVLQKFYQDYIQN
jgi:parvulin-like peptidyl-prolyl isomerase